MKKLQFIIAILMLSLIGKAQSEKINHSQIGKLNFKLYDTKISQTELEEIMNAFAAFGDKNIVFQEILNSLVVPEDVTLKDSLIQYWLKDFSYEEMINLQCLPNIAPHFMEKVYNIVMYSILGQSYLEKIKVVEAYININGKKNASFPNMPSISNITDRMELIERYYKFSKWATNYPDEFSFFQKLIEKQAFYELKSASEIDLIQWGKFLKDYIIQSNTIYDIYIPVSIEALISSTLTKQKEIKYAALCNPIDINVFITKSYELIFEEQISDELLNKLSAYVTDNEVYEPNLIYLSLILSKYE